jgi:hypothetical protein
MNFRRLVGLALTFAIYVTPFLILGFVAKRLLQRNVVDLTDVQVQAGSKRRARKLFLLGAWRTAAQRPLPAPAARHPRGEYETVSSLTIDRSWLWKHESGTYVKLTQAGAYLFA